MTPSATASSSHETSALMLNLVGRKHRAKLATGGTSSLLNESAAAPTSSFARRQLEKLGWRDGEGLGKNRDGISTHIRAIKRQDEVGLGADSTKAAITSAKDMAALAGADDWWKNSLGDTLARLQQNSKKNKKKKKESKQKKKDAMKGGNSDDDDDDGESNKKRRRRHYTDEELFEATGGARFGMRQGIRQHGKWQRTESNISTEEEEKAKSLTEWDGLSAPKIVLNTTATSTTSTSKTEESAKTVTSAPVDVSGSSNSSTSNSSDSEGEADNANKNKTTKEKKSSKRKRDGSGAAATKESTAIDGENQAAKKEKKLVSLVSASDIDEGDAQEDSEETTVPSKKTKDKKGKKSKDKKKSSKKDKKKK